MKRVVKVLLVLIVAVPVLLAGLSWFVLQPRQMDLPLVRPLVSATSAEGQSLLDAAAYTADFDALEAAYVPQRLMSFCGVASSVAVLKALGRDSNQSTFFTDATSEVRSRLSVTFGGMTLPQLTGLLEAHGLNTNAVHGDELTLGEFRSVVTRNLSTPDDFLLVNYQREALGQDRSGHISPLAAYSAEDDMVLLMDTADFKYPHTWVPLNLLHAALLEEDPASGRPRGIVEVSL